ncbi:MAG TPA: DNRLRE domain-containing protein [Nanoarchaeota archaeon]|nr:DNRLRE domain-containing protein [Nanoarchaeota archaeon]
MGKKLILMALLPILALFLSVNAEALSIDGLVKDSADCIDPAYRTVWVYWEGYRNNCPGGYPGDFCASVQVGPLQNMYSISDNSLSDVFPGWGVGSTFLIEVPDFGDGYHSGPVSVVINSLGESPRAPEMNLTSNFLGVVPLNKICADTDNDRINDVSDNCPLLRNLVNGGQPDADGDGYGGPNFYNDGCDSDDNNPLIPEPQAQCGGVITESKTLPHSLFCKNGDGLTIGANNVVLDCAGWRLNGNGTGLSTGIKLASGVQGATVKNCQVRNFRIGLRAPSANNNNNLVFNNFFNNELNVNALGYNTWSITKTLGRNIVGGPYLAGNYWHDYIGRDINWDGIGDTNLPYNTYIQNGGDSAPLTSFLLKSGPPIMINVSIISPRILKFSATESNYVDQENPDTIVCADCSSILFRRETANGNKEMYGFMKFNISAIPSGATIKNATLHYYVGSNLSQPRNFEIYSVQDAGDTWNEASITWNNMPALENARASASFIPQANKWYALDLKPYISEEYSSRNKIVTLVFKASPPANTTNQWAIETEESSHVPFFRIEY